MHFSHFVFARSDKVASSLYLFKRLSRAKVAFRIWVSNLVFASRFAFLPFIIVA